MPALRPAQALAVVFSAAFALFWYLAGDRLTFTNDEGMFLSHASRIAAGEVLYRDLFGLTGPVAYWILALVFKVAGVSLAAAHAVLALELSILTTVVFFAARKVADMASAVIATIIFAALNAADPAMLTNNHRWDADTFGILGIIAVWQGKPALGGFLLALSVWTTPIFAITALTVVAAALLIGQSPWKVVAGGALGALAGVAALTATGSLLAFVENLLWMKKNYSEANRMAYGSVIGGYGTLFEGSDGPFEYALRGLVVLGMTIPAWLPPLCGILLFGKRDRVLLYLYVCGLSMIAAVSPRFDVGHLVFTAPLFYPIAASFLNRAKWAVLPIGAVVGLFSLSAFIQHANTQVIDTPVGRIRADAGSAETVRWLIANIKPGERMFVYPYPTWAYFLTQGKSITRFSMIQPGLFTIEDERIAADEIRRNMPAKIVYMHLEREDFLRIWPASDPNRLALHHLDQFVKENYQDSAQFKNLHLYTPIVRASTAPR